MAEAGPQSLWYASRDGQESGPFLMYELQDRFQSGEIAGDDLVWCVESDDWLPAARVLGSQAAPAPVAVINIARSGSSLPKFVFEPPGARDQKPMTPAAKTLAKKSKAWGASAAQPATRMRQSEPVPVPVAKAQNTQGRSLKPLTIGLIALGVFLPFLLPLFWFAAWRSHKSSSRT